MVLIWRRSSGDNKYRQSEASIYFGLRENILMIGACDWTKISISPDGHGFPQIIKD
jgi:hypothetical protein